MILNFVAFVCVLDVFCLLCLLVKFVVFCGGFVDFVVLYLITFGGWLVLRLILRCWFCGYSLDFVALF